jgi:hypothetical protein
MKKKGIFTENGDLSVRGIVFVVILSVVLALCIDTGVRLYRSHVYEEPAPVLQEVDTAELVDTSRA